MSPIKEVKKATEEEIGETSVDPRGPASANRESYNKTAKILKTDNPVTMTWEDEKKSPSQLSNKVRSAMKSRGVKVTIRTLKENEKKDVVKLVIRKKEK